MNKRTPAVALAVCAAAVLPAAALAKGPSEATITGPGLSSPITFTGNGEGGSGPFGQLVQWSGFFPQTFGQSPDPVLRARPKTSLGPRYTVTYVVPGPSSTDTLRQDLYPYARPAPVTYMEPGQKFFGDQRTLGGWYRGYGELKKTLIKAGLPKINPETRRRGSSREAMTLTAGVGVVLAGAALLLFRRRR